METKEKIYKFLKENKGKRYTYREWARQIKMSESTFQKWILLLLSESRYPKVNQAIYGNSKVVWIE